LLEDGNWFPGMLVGEGPAFGEVVFTTNLTGYQETFTDPSYLGQIVVMTAPMIGNYGVTPVDDESAGPQVSGVVVRELSRTWSSWRGEQSLDSWLAEASVPILTGVDTRAVTRRIREGGAMRGVIAAGLEPGEALIAELAASPSMAGLDLASRATVDTGFSSGEGPLVIAYDFGMKRNIVRMLAGLGLRVEVVPATTPAVEVLSRHPAGVFLSNGPGDPAAVDYAPAMIREIAETGTPIFGICLGHQLISLAFGGRTAKLPYGHRGGNHPVKELATGKVLITTQNHGFAVEGGPEGVPGAAELEVTHVNLNDGTVEGVRHLRLPVFAVQYHPEAAPGPHDAFPHFGEFLEAIRSREPASS
jgi:carbamoyl-phosphate synthase small subunit